MASYLISALIRLLTKRGSELSSETNGWTRTQEPFAYRGQS